MILPPCSANARADAVGLVSADEHSSGAPALSQIHIDHLPRRMHEALRDGDRCFREAAAHTPGPRPRLQRTRTPCSLANACRGAAPGQRRKLKMVAKLPVWRAADLEHEDGGKYHDQSPRERAVGAVEGLLETIHEVCAACNRPPRSAQSAQTRRALIQNARASVEEGESAGTGRRATQRQTQRDGSPRTVRGVVNRRQRQLGARKEAATCLRGALRVARSSRCCRAKARRHRLWRHSLA